MSTLPKECRRYLPSRRSVGNKKTETKGTEHAGVFLEPKWQRTHNMHAYVCIHGKAQTNQAIHTMTYIRTCIHVFFFFSSRKATVRGQSNAGGQVPR